MVEDIGRGKIIVRSDIQTNRGSGPKGDFDKATIIKLFASLLYSNTLNSANLISVNIKGCCHFTPTYDKIKVH